MAIRQSKRNELLRIVERHILNMMNKADFFSKACSIYLGEIDEQSISIQEKKFDISVVHHAAEIITQEIIDNMKMDHPLQMMDD